MKTFTKILSFILIILLAMFLFFYLAFPDYLTYATDPRFYALFFTWGLIALFTFVDEAIIFLFIIIFVICIVVYIFKKFPKKDKEIIKQNNLKTNLGEGQKKVKLKEDKNLSMLKIKAVLSILISIPLIVSGITERDIFMGIMGLIILISGYFYFKKVKDINAEMPKEEIKNKHNRKKTRSYELDEKFTKKNENILQKLYKSIFK